VARGQAEEATRGQAEDTGNAQVGGDGTHRKAAAAMGITLRRQKWKAQFEELNKQISHLNKEMVYLWKKY
jgi:hypothetical protein